MKSISSLKLPHLKQTSSMPAVTVKVPDEVLLPMTMHPGGPAVPVVSVGDYVRVGQLIAKEDGKNSSPVHATVSGTVKAIEEVSLSGKKPLCIRIASDGKMEKDPSLKAPVVTNLDEFLQAVRDSGVVGLGGAAFPLWAKLDAVRKNPVKTVLINGAECEPYITSDDRTMQDHGDMIKKGIDLMREFLKAEEFIIGVENNKQAAIDSLNKVFAGESSVRVMPLDSVYPQGAKQVLLYNATGLVVGEGQRLASLGVIITNVTSVEKMAEYFATGMPLVERSITLEGSAVKNPGNYTVPIGTLISYLVEQSGGLKEDPGKVIYGGPMMGKCAASIDEPVLKATNAVLVMNRADSVKLEPVDCIHCGRCVANCPIGLNPTVFASAMENPDEEERYEILNEYKIGLCISCGSCSYVCPAHRPLADINSNAKRFVKGVQKKEAERKELEKQAQAAKEGEKNGK